MGHRGASARLPARSQLQVQPVRDRRVAARKQDLRMQDIPGARLYHRERSPFYYYSFKGPDGQKVRGSTGCTDEKAAWAELRRIYTRRTQLSFRDAVVSFFEIKAR